MGQGPRTRLAEALETGAPTESPAGHRGQRGAHSFPAIPAPPPSAALKSQKPARQASSLPTFFLQNKTAPASLQGQQRQQACGLVPQELHFQSPGLFWRVGRISVCSENLLRRENIQAFAPTSLPTKANIQVQLLSLQREIVSPCRLKFMNKFRPRVMQTLKAQGRF